MAEDVDLATLQPNTMIEGPLWNGQAAFIGIEGRILTIRQDGETRRIPILETPHNIRPVESGNGEPWKAFVTVERLRHEYAKSLGAFGSADQLPHQLKTIYQVSGEPGRIRYMIADEPGGGKTVVASRIIQELAMQRQAERVLIVVPALLKEQWQEELKRFVNMDSAIIGGDTRGRANPWVSDDRILITSMDYAKREPQMRLLERASFDLVVVDEAHNLNATAKNVTERYSLGKLLGNISKHMIFLTATPHRGKSENFRLLLRLLDPKLFSDRKMSDDAIRHAKEGLFIRHTKDDMIGMDGRRLFRGRSVVSVKYMMSGAERRLYDTVTDYVRRQYNLQMGRDANHIATFAVLIIQKRMASSTLALLKSLRRRRERLGERLEQWDGPMEGRDIDTDDTEYMDEDELAELEDDAAGFTSAQTKGALKRELDELDGLIGLADKTSKTKPDTKLERLLGEIRGIGDDKLLIFSEYRDTLDYLEERIGAMRRADGSPYVTCRIDGKMKMKDRVEAQNTFRTGAQIMLATDAAREGINLQFCHRMVNYDLPWTPISLEQRMGRLHRYGQEHDVVISNMVADGTREGDVMEKLFEKIRLIEKQYPTFNVMGQVLAGSDLKGLITDAIRGGSVGHMAGMVERAAADANKVDEMLGRTPIDVEDVRRRIEQVRGQRTDGEYLERMVSRLFGGLGGRVRHSGGHTTLDVPEAIRSGPLPKRVHRYGMEPAGVFTRGGAIYNHMSEWIRKNCSRDLRSGSVFRDPSGFDGYVIFHTIPIHNRSGALVGRRLAVHKYADGVVDAVDPYILHDMEYGNGVDLGPEPPTDAVERAVLDMAAAEAERMVSERKPVWDHRTRAAIMRVRTELDELGRKKEDLEFGAELNRVNESISGLERLEAEIRMEHETEMTLIPYEPILEGWVRIIPDSEGPRHAKPTEKIGMDASMKHETAEGFKVKDVSKRRGIGYDILSVHMDGRRREIEVKASCDAGNIQFTEAEYEHIKRSEHAVVHALSNAGKPDERLDVVNNPASLKTKRETVHTVTRSEIRRAAG